MRYVHFVYLFFVVTSEIVTNNKIIAATMEGQLLLLATTL